MSRIGGEALSVVRKWSGGPPGCFGVVGRSSQCLGVVGMPSQMFVSSRDDILDVS